MRYASTVRVVCVDCGVEVEPRCSQHSRQMDREVRERELRRIHEFHKDGQPLTGPVRRKRACPYC